MNLQARKAISSVSLKLVDEWKKGSHTPPSSISSPTPSKKPTSLLLEEEPTILISAAPPSDDDSALSSPSATGSPRYGASSGASTPRAATTATASTADSPPAAPTSSAAAARSKRAPGVGVDPGSFLGLMLNARSKETGQQLGDKIVVAQSNTFILAGYETTANTLAFSIYNIAAHPEVQRRVLEEIDAYGRDKAPRVQDLHMVRV